jgi:acetyl-CoA C-acetyltransferase
MRNVYLVTGSNNEFRRAFPEKRTKGLCIEALQEACDYINTTPQEFKKHIHSCYYGHFAGQGSALSSPINRWSVIHE